jgi:hypothetical protein
MTPSVSFSYIPAIQGGIGSYTNANGEEILYSKHQNSVYSEGLSQDVGRLDFTVVNNFEIKQRDDRDTLTGFRKLKIIDNLVFSTSYDIFKDSMNWGNMTFGMLINPVDAFTVNIAGLHSFYAWDEQSGASLSQYATQTGQGIGRLLNGTVSSMWTITSKKGREVLQDQQTEMATVWNPQYQAWLMTPAQLVSFEIPWKLSFNHVLGLTLNSDSTAYSKQRYSPQHTLGLNGDVSITENWKIVANTYFDLKAMKVANTSLTLYRNIHCWNVLFNWTPIGTNKSFMITIRGNGNALSNAQLRLQKPPLVF